CGACRASTRLGATLDALEITVGTACASLGWLDMSRNTDVDLDRVYQELVQRSPGEVEFHQSARMLLRSLPPVLAKHPDLGRDKLIERICEPERQIIFRVPWQDDAGQ